MERIAAILADDIFRDRMERIGQLEEDRIFCRHGIGHLLDVARIAWITCLERDIALDKEVVYGAALLHDIGRLEEYTDGTPHEMASGEWAMRILPDCGFSAEETEMMCRAIMSHRKEADDREERDDLSEVIRYADKAARLCFMCDAANECKWDDSKRTQRLER